jgi:hypothetical protein
MFLLFRQFLTMFALLRSFCAIAYPHPRSLIPQDPSLMSRTRPRSPLHRIPHAVVQVC